MAEQTGSSEQVATQVATNTGTSGGSAGNNTTTGGAGSITSVTPVVAPKGFRSELQQMLQGWQQVIPGDSTVTSGAGSLTEAAVVAQLQGYLGPYMDLDTHVTATRQARAQVPIHNNFSERELRREAVGRKNWLFIGTDDAGEVNANFVSLIASAQLHDLEPWAYLRDLLCLLPGWPSKCVLDLAPAYWTKTIEAPRVSELLAGNLYRRAVLSG